MTSYNLSPLQWLLLGLGAFFSGVSKTGLPGVGIFSVALFASILPAREASGVVLPFLIAADIVAVKSYHEHAQWKYLKKLFPVAAAGIAVGALTVRCTDDRAVEVLVGAILAVIVALQLWRKRKPTEEVPSHAGFALGTGLAAGFTTMIANAAGPIISLFLLAMRLPKMSFMGTAAWYFLALNVFKVPFSIGLGLISVRSLGLSGPMIACAVAGALLGKRILARLNQKAFEALALSFAALAAIRLLVG